MTAKAAGLVLGVADAHLAPGAKSLTRHAVMPWGPTHRNSGAAVVRTAGRCDGGANRKHRTL